MSRTVGQLIEAKKASLGLQSDGPIAEACGGVSAVTVGRWRKKNAIPHDEHLEPIARWLEITMDDLDLAITATRRVRAGRTPNGQDPEIELLESQLREALEQIDALKAPPRSGGPRRSVSGKRPPRR